MLQDLTNTHHSRVALKEAANQLHSGPPVPAFIYGAPAGGNTRGTVSAEWILATAISPSAAATELDIIQHRLTQITQGVKAWTSLHGQTSTTAVQEAEAVTARIYQTQGLLYQCNPSRVPYYRQQQPPALPQAAKEALASPKLQQCQQPSPRNQVGQPAVAHSGKSTKRPGSGSHGQSASANSDSYHRPVAHPRGSTLLPQSKFVMVVVEFKRCRMRRFVSDKRMEPGSYAMVPGDRGYDCGLVVQCGVWVPESASYEEGTLKHMDGSPINILRMKDEITKVVREATDEEVAQLYGEQASKERLALSACRGTVERMGLDMNVVDCEYQFDGTKISFYFEAERSIDFRDLNKELFRIFNARIWLENVNSAVKNTLPEGAISQSDKTQYRQSALKHN